MPVSRCFVGKPPANTTVSGFMFSFMLHLKRANYVTRIRKQTLSRYPEKLNPADHGWEIEKNKKNSNLLVQFKTCS